MMVGLMFPFDTHNMRSHYDRSWLSQKPTSTDLSRHFDNSLTQWSLMVNNDLENH